MNRPNISAVTEAEFEQALALLFQSLPSERRRESIAQARAMFEKGELDREGLLVARQATEVTGVMLAGTAPGAIGLVWPPQVKVGPYRDAVEDVLVDAAKAWLRKRGAKLAQTLLRPDERALGGPLARKGFPYVTQLSFLRRPLEDSDLEAGTPETLTYDCCGEKDTNRFEATLLRTYEGTLDCPELNDVRTIDEILAGHRAQGEFDPQHWWLACEGGQPVGVLLMNWMPDCQSWEIVYMGLVPEARGRGLGRQLMLKALREARREGGEHVTLTVDARNHLALNLYERLGFEVWDGRAVHLAILAPGRS